MKFYVYFLIDPRTNTVFYVRKGTKKLQTHLYHMAVYLDWCSKDKPVKKNSRFDSKKLYKIDQIIEAELEVQYEITYETNDEQEAFLQECNCIAAFGRENLTNLTDGGDGCAGIVWSEESKIRKSKFWKELWKDLDFREKMILAFEKRGYKGENNPFYGKKHTAETKEKLSASKSEGTKNKISNTLKELYSDPKNHPNYGKKHSEETKRKIRDSCSKKTPWNKGKKTEGHSVEHKKKISESMKRRVLQES